MKSRHGFTLIELLVVIAIIALLLAILLPGLKRAKEYAKRVVCSSQLRQCGIGVKMYSDANDEYLPDAHYLDGNDNIDMDRPFPHSYVVYRLSDSTTQYSNGRLKPFRFAYLYEEGYIDTPKIFYCPGNREEWMKYESYTNPTPWGTLPQDYNTTNQWVRIGYTYYPTDARPKLLSDGVPEDNALKFTRLNQNIPYTTDVIHRRGVISHRHNDSEQEDGTVTGIFGLNALYADGHVTFCNNQTVLDAVNPATGVNVWDRLDTGIGSLRDYAEAYYTVFRAIGP